MADELTLEIVTPEKMAFKGVVEEVTIPGTEGEFGVLRGHASLLSSVDVGELSFTQDHKKTCYAVNTGYAEVTASKVTVLVETAERSDHDRPRKGAPGQGEGRGDDGEAPQRGCRVRKDPAGPAAGGDPAQHRREKLS